jgi:hypothetical protein
VRRAKKRKNSSSARHYDQITFRFRTAKTRSGREAVVHAGPFDEPLGAAPDRQAQ